MSLVISRLTSQQVILSIFSHKDGSDYSLLIFTVTITNSSWTSVLKVLKCGFDFCALKWEKKVNINDQFSKSAVEFSSDYSLTSDPTAPSALLTLQVKHQGVWCGFTQQGHSCHLDVWGIGI